MRQIVLDTETTGLEVEQNHRIVEIGCVELLNRRITGRVFHHYLNPERDIDEGAKAVHGLSREQLESEPKFEAIAPQLLEFLSGAELIIHNAPFDVGFLNAELQRLAPNPGKIGDHCTVRDTLVMARQMHPGQRNNLDALCKRYSVDNSRRDFHGALLDARILAEVYLAMTGGQAMLTLGHEEVEGGAAERADRASAVRGRKLSIPVVQANSDELLAHEGILALIDKASGGATVWRKS